MFGRKKIAALVAEFLGTGILTLVVLGVQRSTIGIPYFVAIAAGLAVAFMVLAMSTPISRVHLNPAVTIGLWTARCVTTTRAVVFIVAQLLGAWAAHGVYTYFIHTGLPAVGGVFSGHALVAEAIGTGVIGFGFAALRFRQVEAGASAGVAGLSYALGIVIAAAAAIGFANPALALGAHAWNIWGSLGWGNYVLGPVVGAIVGVNLYVAFFAPESALKSFSVSRKKVSGKAKARPARARA